MHLRHTTQTVSVLNSWIIFEMRLADLTVAQQFSQVRSDFHLAQMRTRSVNALVESDWSTFESFEGHCARNVCKPDELFGAMKCQSADRAHGLSSIQQREAFFHFQQKRRDLRAFQSRGRG